MKRFPGRSALCACVAAALAAGSCAFAGRREAPIPCADEHLACLPFGASAPGCELAGRVRIDLPRYRFRGLCRILHGEGGRLRIDFEHSSLFGAVERHLTILAGESLVIHDNGEGSYLAGDSALAAVAGELGARIEPDDILYALLLAFPGCAGISEPSLERRGGDLDLKGLWRGREIVLRCSEREGVRRFEQRFPSSGRRFIIEYEGVLEAGEWRYPRRIRLSREGGPERVSIDLIEIKSVTPDSLELVAG